MIIQLLLFRTFTKFFIVLMLAAFSFNVFSRDLTYKVRKPASAPDEEVMTVPNFDRPLLLTIFADDDGGVMAGMRNAVIDWNARDEYARNWNLESSGLYKTPTDTERRQYVMNRLLKYADKRLSGEVRNAEEGSTFHTVGKVEKSLRPNTEVQFSKLISLKFKVRVLQGKAIMEVRNPWVECNTTIAANGKVKLETKKEIKETGTTPGAEFQANSAEWIIYVDQKISENLKARVSSTQKNQSLFNNDADKKLEMTASFPFEM